MVYVKKQKGAKLNNSASFENMFNNALKKAKKDKIESSGKKYDIISFAKECLLKKPYPAQEIVLKMFYAGTRYNENVRLTDEEIEIIKSWSFPQTWIFEGENSKYQAYLKNIENFAKDPSSNFFRELILVLGRRSGKSWMTSVISVYEAYKLISVYDPISHFKIDNDIWIVNTAITGKQAEDIIFKPIKQMILTCPLFEGRICKVSDDQIVLYSDANIDRNKKLEELGLPLLPGNIVLASGNSNSVALRGHTNAMTVYDEFAHFVDTSGKSSGDSTYASLQPSASNLYIYGEGRNVIISSPDLPSGFFYDHFQAYKTENTALVFQIPSWDANPTITREMLEPDFRSNPDKAAAEYGAQFRFNASSNLIPREFVDAALIRKKDWYKQKDGSYSFRYFMHIDPAKNSDRWAVMIGHKEYRFDEGTGTRLMWVVEDYSKTFVADPGKVLDPEIIMNDFILPLFDKFNIASVTSDSFFSVEQQNKLKRAGHPFKEISYNGPSKNKIYETMKDYFLNGRIELCNDDTDLAGELKNITIDYSRNPPKIDKNKNDKDYPNDDLADCLGGIILAMNDGVKGGNVRLPPCGVAQTAGFNPYFRR